MTNSLLETVRRAYKKEDFWANEAKRLYPAFSMFRQTIKLDITIASFVKEFGDVEEHYSSIPMLERTGESLKGFLSRLAAALTFRGLLSAAEYQQIRAFQKGERSFPVPTIDRAQAVFFKACLELGEKRPATRKSGPIRVGDLRTVGELLEYPLDKPLPKINPAPEAPLTFDARSHEISRAKTTVEYHLAIARDVADWDYWGAVQEVAARFENLADAHKSLKNKGKLTASEQIFVSRYERYKEHI